MIRRWRQLFKRTPDNSNDETNNTHSQINRFDLLKWRRKMWWKIVKDQLARASKKKKMAYDICLHKKNEHEHIEMSSNLDAFFSSHSFVVSHSVTFIFSPALSWNEWTQFQKMSRATHREIEREKEIKTKNNNNNSNNNKKWKYTNLDYHRNMFRTINLLACNIIKKIICNRMSWAHIYYVYKYNKYYIDPHAHTDTQCFTRINIYI